MIERRMSNSCASLLGGLPPVGQQFGQAVVRMAGDAGQNVAKVGEGFNIMALLL